jgi:hypothetical protein
VKMFLSLSGAGLYYAGSKDWVRDREQALDLETIERAIEVAGEGDLDSMVIVLSSGHPSSDWFLPIRPRQGARVQPAPGSVQAPVQKATQVGGRAWV